jgi:hypothetical protein
MDTNPKELLEGDVFVQDGSGWVAGPHGYDAAPDGTITVACYKMPDYEARTQTGEDSEGDPVFAWNNEHEDTLTQLPIFAEHPVDVIRNIGEVTTDREGTPPGKVDVPPNALN